MPGEKTSLHVHRPSQKITRSGEATGGPAGATTRRTRQADRLQMAGGLAHFRWSEPDGGLVQVVVEMITAHRAMLGAVEPWVRRAAITEPTCSFPRHRPISGCAAL